MENKLNIASLGLYAEKISQKIIKSAEFDNGKISGKEILGLSEISQINLFVIERLYELWRKEVDTIESLYFDYTHKEVKEAMASFMNVLSKHISVKEGDLLPLLKTAIVNSLYLLLSPYDFFLDKINKTDWDKISIEDLKDGRKYIKTNKQLWSVFLEELESEGKKSRDEALELFDRVCGSISFSPEEIDPHIISFSKIEHLEISFLYDNSPDQVEEVVENDENINQHLKEEVETINEKLAQQEKISVLDHHQKSQKIDSINEHLSINERFKFINELFAEDKKEFESVLHEVESLDSYDKAYQYLGDKYINTNTWDESDEGVQHFLKVIKKRFS